MVLVLGAALAACGDDPPKNDPDPTMAVPTAQAPTSANPSQTNPTAPSSQGPAAMLPGRYQPLWPFADPAQVRDWQRAYRAGGTAPWEVVGSDDTALQPLSPSYASRVSSPLVVGGRITGVDESVRVTVRQLGSSDPVGSHCCIVAGGQNTLWSAKVAFTAGNGRVLTIVASTGGHLKDVERFTLTGVRP